MNINRAVKGHIKLSHTLKESDLMRDKNAFFVFVQMLMAAHYEDNYTSIRFGGKQTYLKRGEFACTMSELALITELPIGTLRKIVDRLEEDKRISKRSDHQITIFSICNYHKHQDSHERQNATSRANERANDRANEVANDRANVTEGKKNIKNIKNNKYISKEKSLVKKETNDQYDKAMEYWSGRSNRSLSKSKSSKEHFTKLIKAHGAEEVGRAINAAVYFEGKPYKPQVFSFKSMDDKWDMLQGYMTQELRKGVTNASNRFE